MKKFFATLLCYCLLGQMFCAAHNAEKIIDDFALKTLNPNLKIEIHKSAPIIDEFALNTLNSNLEVKKPQYKPIVDDFALKTLDLNLKVSKAKRNFNFESLHNPTLKISAINPLSTKRNLKEGQTVEFIVMNDTIKNIDGKDILIKKGTPVSARVETISQNDIRGVPADLILGNFIIDNKIKASGQIKVRGANRMLWVYPLGTTLSILFGVGAATIFIRGGHAKIRPNRVYEIDL